MRLEIRLKSIRAVNFMACDDKTYVFDGDALVSGMNGRGKSTIASAYMWLIFGCDSELRDNPFVRRKIGGEPVNDTDVSVEAVFDFDGREITAKKVQKRTFKKDGSYSDDNVYFINECPKTLKAFNEFFETDMKIFKMCSNMAVFLSKKDKEMREYLFEKIEDVSDLEIATKNAELFELVALLRDYKAEEIAAMNKASVAKINKELPILGGQIKEKERDVTAGADVDLAELELFRNSLKDQIAENQAKQTDLSKQLADYQRQTDDILKLKFKLSDMARGANAENERKRREIRNRINDTEGEKSRLSLDVAKMKRQLSQTESEVEADTKEIYRQRDLWNSHNKEIGEAQERVFDDSALVCPHCGQEYPEEKKDTLRAEFESRKEKEIDVIKGNIKSIEEKGSVLKAKIKDGKAEAERINAEIEKMNSQITELDKVVDTLAAEMNAVPDSVDISQNQEYVALQKEISEKESALAKENSADEIRKTLKAEEEDLRSQLSEIEMKIAAADKTRDEERLEELKEQQLDMEQKKADAEKILNLLDELDKLKNETLSEEINSLFGLVEWKLFDYQKNGGYKSCCVPMVDKKSILTTESNTGNRFLGQTDILNSLQRIEGISCPVFIDGAEALDSENLKKAVGMMNCQVIALKVSDGEELEVVEI